MNATETVHLCDCGAHGIAVNRVDWDDDGKDVEVELSVWAMGGHDGCSGWQQRLRYIWYIVRYGHPYPNDWIGIDREKARELAAAILKAAE